MNWKTMLALGAWVVSCGKAPEPLPVMPCEDAALSAGREVPLGGRVVVGVEAGSQVTELEVTAAGAFTARQLDATHVELKAGYEASEASVELALHCGERHGVAATAVKTRAPAWTALSQWTDGDAAHPLNREYGVMWQDAQDADRLLLFGGFTYKPKQFTPAFDLWELKLSTGAWAPLTTTNAPPQFVGGRVAAVPGQREVIFTGGVNPQFEPRFHVDRLEYGSLTWASVSAQGAPAYGDYQPGLVFDSKRNRYVSVCGQSSMFHCDAAVLKLGGDGPATWTAMPVTGASPLGRAGHFFAYDEPGDRVIVFGGTFGANDMLGDTWALELGSEPAKWVKLADNPELKRRNGAFALDAANHRLVVWGGTPDGMSAADGVLFLDLDPGHEKWVTLTLAGPASRASAIAVYDAVGKRVVAGFGNSSLGSYPDLWSLAF